MASFLRNDGDIILDAVLTDYGRKLLAKGDGSFNIVKFALADDEIDYGRYDTTLESVARDVEIMNTPILEAFMNNAASMKHKLMTFGMQNILYMPIMKVNTQITTTKVYEAYVDAPPMFIIPVDTSGVDTSSQLGNNNVNYLDNKGADTFIYVDQGIDSANLDPTKNLKETNNMLFETAYNVYVDSRFCSVSDNDGMALSPLSIDDDGIAVYKFTEQSGVPNINHVTRINEKTTTNQVITGTKGSRLKFTLIPNRYK